MGNLEPWSQQVCGSLQPISFRGRSEVPGKAMCGLEEGRRTVGLLGCMVRTAPIFPTGYCSSCSLYLLPELTAPRPGLRLVLRGPKRGQQTFWEARLQGIHFEQVNTYLPPPSLGPATNHQFLHDHLPNTMPAARCRGAEGTEPWCSLPWAVSHWLGSSPAQLPEAFCEKSSKLFGRLNIQHWGCLMGTLTSCIQKESLMPTLWT